MNHSLPTARLCKRGDKPRSFRTASPASLHQPTLCPCGLEAKRPQLCSRGKFQHIFTLTAREVCKCESEVAQSCPTLCDPMDCSLPGSSIHGIFQQEYWSGLPFPSPGALPGPGIEPRSPASQTDALPSEPPGNPLEKCEEIRTTAPRADLTEASPWFPCCWGSCLPPRETQHSASALGETSVNRRKCNTAI